MDIKVNKTTQAAVTPEVNHKQQVDGNFKFVLASHIGEAQLQEHLTHLMEEITRQGDKLAKHREIK